MNKFDSTKHVSIVLDKFSAAIKRLMMFSSGVILTEDIGETRVMVTSSLTQVSIRVNTGNSMMFKIQVDTDKSKYQDKSFCQIFYNLVFFSGDFNEVSVKPIFNSDKPSNKSGMLKFNYPIQEAQYFQRSLMDEIPDYEVVDSILNNVSTFDDIEKPCSVYVCTTCTNEQFDALDLDVVMEALEKCFEREGV